MFSIGLLTRWAMLEKYASATRLVLRLRHALGSFWYLRSRDVNPPVRDMDSVDHRAKRLTPHAVAHSLKVRASNHREERGWLKRVLPLHRADTYWTF